VITKTSSNKIFLSGIEIPPSFHINGYFSVNPEYICEIIKEQKFTKILHSQQQTACRRAYPICFRLRTNTGNGNNVPIKDAKPTAEGGLIHGQTFIVGFTAAKKSRHGTKRSHRR
jgi:hypothetical protein